MKYETNSKLIKPGQIFVAIVGNTVDGHDYIHEAIKNGAAKIIAQKPIKVDIPYEIVPSTEEYLKEHLKNEYPEFFNSCYF